MNLPPERKNSLASWLVFGTVIWVLGIFFFGALWFVSYFAFDAPGSERNYWIWAQVILWRGCFIACVTSPIAAWLAYGFKWRRLSIALILLPPLWVALFLTVLFGATQICGLDIACSAWASPPPRPN